MWKSTFGTELPSAGADFWNAIEPGHWRTLLYVGDGEILRLSGVSGADGQTERYGVGPKRLARQAFASAFPDGLALETGIAQVEDVIMFPQVRTFGQTGLLVSPLLADLLESIGHAGCEALTRAEIELAFSDLAAVAQGAPMARYPVAKTPQQAALLLILRELVHHWDLAQVRLFPAT